MAANTAPSPDTNETQTPQTKTEETKSSTSNNNSVVGATPSNIVLTPEQFTELISRLGAGSSTDKASAPSMTPGVGLQTNPFGQVVGTVTKFNIQPDYYPNPVEDLLADFDDDVRMRRHNLRENYFITFDMTAKPYQTKDNLSVQEPTFHLTLYANEFDDDGEATSRAYVIQTLHMNEDEELARIYASEQGVEVNDEGLRKLMDDTRYWRIRDWLVAIFYPPRNFEMNTQESEEAIGGSVVKVVTKSNVKGFGNKAPKIKDEELS